VVNHPVDACDVPVAVVHVRRSYSPARQCKPPGRSPAWRQVRRVRDFSIEEI
jgi:hypothetical protein